MFFKKEAGLIIVSLLSMQCFFAQPSVILKKRFPVKSLSYEDGLLDNIISGIVTDGDGFTWVSTFTGLQRYNGYKLQTINPIVGQDTFHINSPVYLFELNTGNILISNKNGVLKYDTHTNQFTRFIDLEAKQLFHFSIVPLEETSDGMWCMQQDKGIVLYDKYGKIVKPFSFISKEDIDEILRTDNILFEPIITYNDQFIYISIHHNTVLCIDTKNETASKIKLPDNALLGISTWHDKLFLAEKDQLIMINNNGAGDRKIIKMKLNPVENITGVSLQRYNNNIYLSRNGSLYSVDTAGNIQYELTDQNKKPFVQNGNIEKVYLDKFNRLWILSNNDIKRVENEELFFQNFTYSNSPGNFIRAMYFDTSKNILLAAGYDGLIEAFDTLASPLWDQPVTTKSSEYILNIEKLSNDEFLVTAFNAAPFIFNIKTKKTYPLIPAPNAVRLSQTNYPCNLQRINDSIIFIATNATVYKCVFNKTKIISATPLVNFIKDNKLNCFLYDSSKKLWVGTANGLLYIIDNGKINNVIVPGNYVVRSMAENRLHQILIGTEKGLFIYNDTGALIKSYTIASGLRNDCIYAIAVENNTYFVSTNLGISSIDEQGTIHNYAKAMGLQDNEFNTNAVVKLKNGKIFFGGINGITAFYPDMLSLVKDKPLIHVTQFAVNGVSYNSSSGIWSGNAIHLAYNENRLQFDIAAIGMLNVNEYVYQYRLKNLDTTWQTSYEPANINYTLQPGNYTLEIKCHSLFSSNNEFIKSYPIIITPPFWQTWWFRTLSLVAAIAVVYFFIYRYNKNKYQRKIRLLETRQQVQTERERISRELHDNIGSQLSLMINNIDWTIDSAERMTKPEEMQRLAAINTTAKNVMTNLRESIWALNKEKITMEEFADKLKAYIQNVIDAKPGLELVSTESIKSNITFSPTETLHLFRICQEVINNIIKHAEATRIKIFLESGSDKKFSVSIEDNGKGFDASVKKGYGLENIMHRAKEMGIQLQVQSEKNKGTIIRICK